MKNTQVAFETVLEAETCYKCGLVFAMPHALVLQLKRSHAVFYCPAGHGQCYATESSEEKLDKEVKKYRELLRREREYAASVVSERNAAQRSLSATKGVLTRTKKRIANGVCPCCHRTFAELQKHMASQHPEYETKEEVSE
jgi:hypothetical protein